MSTGSFRCRACEGADLLPFLDLGALPLANRLPADLSVPEARHPLVAVVCRSCRLVQLTHDIAPEVIFADYPYFSSVSASWVAHAGRYAATAVERLSLGPAHRVIEIASNDGYLLRHFMDRGIPVLGIEPSDTVAAAARAAGVPTDGRFFGSATARSLVEAGTGADLLVANNVLAHVPALNDFVAGLAVLLRPTGTLTIEVPHLLRLIEGVQFDTIYHEHFCYFSLHALEALFARHGLRVADVEELSTHGGSLRLWVRHAAAVDAAAPAVARIRRDEAAAGFAGDAAYTGFGDAVRRCLADLRAYLDTAAAEGRRVAGYGAAAKAATLLGACGATARDLAFIADANPHKQGRHLPGTGIPIVAPERIFADRPDDILILPWNLKAEIVSRLEGARAWGARFVVPIPTVTVVG